MSATTTRTLGSLGLTIGLFVASFVSLHPEPVLAFREGGATSFLALLGLLLGFVFATISKRTTEPFPSAIAGAFAVMLPLVCGAFGHAWAVMNVERALRSMSPELLGTITTVGFHESLRPLEIGAIGSAVIAAVCVVSAFDLRGARLLKPLAFAATAVFSAVLASGLARYSDALAFFSGNEFRSILALHALDAASEAESIRRGLGVFTAAALVAIAARVHLGRATEDPTDLVFALAFAAIVAIPVVSLEWSTKRLSAIAHPSFLAHLDSFDSLRLLDDPLCNERLIVLPTFAVDGSRRFPLDHGPLVQSLGRLASTPPGTGDRRRVAVALDARATSDVILRVLAAARDAEVADLELHGVAPLGPYDPGRERVDAHTSGTFTRVALPILAATTIPLVRPAIAQPTSSDERLEVGATPAILAEQVAPAGNGAGELGSSAPHVVQLRLGANANATSLVESLVSIRRRGHAAVVVAEFVPDPLPEHPATGIGMLGSSIRPGEPVVGADAAADLLNAPGAAISAPSPDAAAAIRREFQTRSRAIRRCFEAGLARDPSLSGRADIEMTIVEGGMVSNLAVQTDDFPRAVTACIAHAVRAERFPDPGPGAQVTIHYPVVLSPTP